MGLRYVMGLPATFVLYLVIGVGVEGALLTSRDPQPVARWFSVLTGILFWPLYVPILLTRTVGEPLDDVPSGKDHDEVPAPKQCTGEVGP